MSNMGYGLLSFTISCILLTAKCVSSQNHFVSSEPINQDWIYFVRPTVNQQPLSIQQQNIQWQAANQQQLAIQQQKANQQPLAIQQPTTNQLNIQQRRDQDREDQDYRSTSMMKAKEIIRFGETATALTDFSINLMKLVIQQTPGNTVASPYSIATLLALLQQGATGATLEQLSEALHMNQQTSAAAYKAHIDDIQKRNSNNTLRIANNIFLANGFNLNNAFRAVALRDFHSDVTLTNFALPTQTAQEINRWVAKKTDNKIDNLISPAALGINTQMVLVNAMYFKGLWQAPFRREATKPGEFLLSNGVIKMAKFMQTRRYYKTGVDSYTGSKVIVVPFELNEYSLMVILPNSLSTVADTLSTLTVSRLEEYSNFPHLETQLELPKFSIKADTDLTPVLKQMGISKLFAGSELSNIGISQASQSPQVSTAVHSAALTIDEEGGSASAATAFAVVALSNDDPSVTFKANRPFLAVLWDGKSKLPLFMAKIEDPTI